MAPFTLITDAPSADGIRFGATASEATSEYLRRARVGDSNAAVKVAADVGFETLAQVSYIDGIYTVAIRGEISGRRAAVTPALRNAVEWARAADIARGGLRAVPWSYIGR